MTPSGGPTQTSTIPSPHFHHRQRGPYVDEAERHLGFELPHLLVRIYLEVANGGFGPGFGLLGVNGGWTDSDMDLVEWALLKRTLGCQRQCRLILCHHGCAVYSIVHCTTPDLEVLRRDGRSRANTRGVTGRRAAWFWSWATDDPLPLPDTFAQELYALFSGHGINSHELYLELESIEEAHEWCVLIQLALPADDPEFPGRLSKTMHIWESHRMSPIL